VAAKRTAFLNMMAGVAPARLVFIDEAGANLAMGRVHAWVRRGAEYIEPRPMNRGDNLTLIGAVRLEGVVALATQWQAVNAARFTTWVRECLAPRLRRDDVVLLDNLSAHKAAAARELIERRGESRTLLPPYSPDFNPIEPVWALVKKHIRARAPRSAGVLRRVARAARYVVRPHHCRQFFAHAGYVNSSA
jgi:transposase